MITSVSASEDNITDTISTTDNMEVNSVSIEDNVTDTISAVDNLEISSATNFDETNNDNLTNEHDSENTVDSNGVLEEPQDVEGSSVQNKEELLGSVNNVLTNSYDANNPLTNKGDNILSITSNKLLTENPSIIVVIDEDNYYVKIEVEVISKNNYKWSIVETYGSWTGLMRTFQGTSTYSSIYTNELIAGKSSGYFSCTDDSLWLKFRSRIAGEYINSEKFYLPVLSEEVDTTVTITNPSLNYNSGTFDVSGTETGMMIC